MDYVVIGCTPAEEECVQVGAQDYHERVFVECNAFIDAIRKKLGKEPSGAQLAVKAFPHDFGTYHEVVCYFSNPIAMEYAFRCESDAPQTWAEVGMQKP